MLVIRSCCRIANCIRKQLSYAAKRVTAAAPYASMPEPVNPASAQVVNQHLLADLTRAGLWTRDLKNELVGRQRLGAGALLCVALKHCAHPVVLLAVCSDKWWRACAWLENLISCIALPSRTLPAPMALCHTLTEAVAESSGVRCCRTWIFQIT